MSSSKLSRKSFLKMLSGAVLASVATSDVIISSYADETEETKNAATQGLADDVNPEIYIPETRIVSDDTIYSGYVPPILVNDARMRYSEIVGQNAEKVFPNCKPYLEAILKANYDFRTIFDIPPEYNIGLFKQESNFNPNAVSFAPAVGIAQFMRATASGMGMKVYSAEKFPELYKLEMKLKEISSATNKAWSVAYSCFKNNDFENIKPFKLKYNELKKERTKITNELYEYYLIELVNLDDERKDPFVSILKSVRLFAELSRQASIEYGGKEWHNIIRGLAAYNCGFGNVLKGEGLPYIQETNGYVRRILIHADKIAPEQSIGLIYTGNPEVFKELCTAQMYRTVKVEDPYSHLGRFNSEQTGERTGKGSSAGDSAK